MDIMTHGNARPKAGAHAWEREWGREPGRQIAALDRNTVPCDHRGNPKAQAIAGGSRAEEERTTADETLSKEAENTFGVTLGPGMASVFVEMPLA